MKSCAIGITQWSHFSDVFFSSTVSVPSTDSNLQVASEYSSRSSPKELLQEFPSEVGTCWKIDV